MNWPEFALQLQLSIKYCQDHGKLKSDVRFSKIFDEFLDASTHLYKRVCPCVGPSVRQFVGPSVRNAFVSMSRLWEKMVKWLGKQFKCSKLLKQSSEWSPNVPKCPQMSPNVPTCLKCPKMSTSDASLSERTCYCKLGFLRSTRKIIVRSEIFSTS